MSRGPLEWLEGGLTRVPGVAVGHATHERGGTGVTAALFDAPAPGGVDIRGGAAGTRQFSALDPMHVVQGVDAVVFAGGSAHGLEAGTGAMRWLERRGRGLPVVPGQTVPIVPTAILFDLPVGEPGIRPDAAMGEAALDAATKAPVVEGSVGAGTGASVGKCEGPARAMKGGVGSAVCRLPSGVTVGVLAVVNAFGDVVDPASGKPVAGLRAGPRSRKLASSHDAMLARGTLRRYGDGPAESATHTTLVLVATDARLDPTGLTWLARQASHGLVRTIDPCQTVVDGDLVLAATTAGPGAPAADATILGLAAAEAVSRSILRAVRLARGRPGLPGLADG